MSHEHHHGHECCENEHKHEHNHHEEEESLKGRIILIAVTAILLAAAFIIEKKCDLPAWQLLLIYLVPYLLVGWETLKEAAEGVGLVKENDKDTSDFEFEDFATEEDAK